MKKFSSTAIWGLVAVAIVSYAYFFEYKQKEADQKAKEESTVILKGKKDDVSRVEIIRADGGLVLEKVESKWVVKKPVEDAADQSAVQAWIDQLLTEKSEVVIDDYEESKLNIYGLQTPKSSIQVGFSDGSKSQIELGTEAMDGKSYVKLAGQKPVIVGSNSWAGYGEKRAMDFREKSLFRFEERPVKSLTFRVPSKKTDVLFELKDSKWIFKNPSGLEADHSQVEDLLSQLKKLKGTDIVKEDKQSSDAQKLGFKSAHVYAKIEFQDGTPAWELNVSPVKEGKSGYAVANSLRGVFDLPKATVDGFMKGVEHFRDRTAMFKFDKTKVADVFVNIDSLKIQLNKSESGWITKALDPKKELDAAKVDDLIERVGNLRAKDFLGAGRGLVGPVKGELVLKDKEGNVLFNGQWGAEDKKLSAVPVKIAGLKELVSLEPHMLTNLPTKEILKDKTAATTTEAKP